MAQRPNWSDSWTTPRFTPIPAGSILNLGGIIDLCAFRRSPRGILLVLPSTKFWLWYPTIITEATAHNLSITRDIDRHEPLYCRAAITVVESAAVVRGRQLTTVPHNQESARIMDIGFMDWGHAIVLMDVEQPEDTELSLNINMISCGAALDRKHVVFFRGDEFDP